jgi:hypothetical protein
MIRPALVLLATIVAVSAHGQGIRGVTRRTPTQEFQAPARQFFDAAGININGTNPRGPAASDPTLPGPSSAGLTRPAASGPLLSNKSGQAPVQARPYVLGKPPSAPANTTTNRAALASIPLNSPGVRAPARPFLQPTPAAAPTRSNPIAASPTHPLPTKP